MSHPHIQYSTKDRDSITHADPVNEKKKFVEMRNSYVTSRFDLVRYCIFWAQALNVLLFPFYLCLVRGKSGGIEGVGRKTGRKDQFNLFGKGRRNGRKIREEAQLRGHNVAHSLYYPCNKMMSKINASENNY